MDEGNPQEHEEEIEEILIGRTGSGEGVFVHFQRFGEQTGRFELFGSVNEADAFLRQFGLSVGSPSGRKGGSTPAPGSDFTVQRVADPPPNLPPGSPPNTPPRRSPRR